MTSLRGAGSLLDLLSRGSRNTLLLAAILLLAGIAWLDWVLGERVTLGALYVLPVLLLSGVLSRTQILLTAIVCVALRTHGTPPTSLAEGTMNGFFALIAYSLIGVFAAELIQHRHLMILHLSEIQLQQSLRVQAEEQLRLLAESSPAAIFTLNERGELLSANRATRELLGLGDGPVTGLPVGENLPVLAEALKLDIGDASFRTVAQVQGARFDDTRFLAQACFSTYRAEGGALRLAAIAFDLTEDTREREEQSHQQLLESNRITAGAVAHEVRNVCMAMSVLYSNLEKVPGVSDNRDYQSLGRLVEGMGRLAHLELRKENPPPGGSADVLDTLNLLRILIEPAWRDAEGTIDWPDLRQPLLVAADPFTLLQVFLNLSGNSLSAVADTPRKHLSVVIEHQKSSVDVWFRDTGRGVPDADSLFQPFRSESGGAGLGLYISRALLRHYGGDLRCEPGAGSGAQFVVEIPLHGVNSDVRSEVKRYPAAVAG